MSYNNLPLLKSRGGVPLRQYIVCDTIDRISGPPGEASFTLNQPVQNVHSIRLESATIPYTWNNIVAPILNGNTIIYPYHTGDALAGSNDYIPLYEVGLAGGAQYIVVGLPSGQYSTTNIGSAVGTALTTASTLFGNGYTYTAIYDNYSGKITITSTGNFQLLWTTDWNNYPYYNNKSTSGNFMYTILGYNYVNQSASPPTPDPDTPLSTSSTSSGFCQLSIKNIYMNVAPFGSSTITSGVNSNVTYAIPIGGNFADYIIFNANNNYHSDIFFASKNLSMGGIKVKISYPTGYFIDFNGQDSSYVFSYLQYED